MDSQSKATLGTPIGADLPPGIDMTDFWEAARLERLKTACRECRGTGFREYRGPICTHVTSCGACNGTGKAVP